MMPHLGVPDVLTEESSLIWHCVSSPQFFVGLFLPNQRLLLPMQEGDHLQGSRETSLGVMFRGSFDVEEGIQFGLQEDCLCLAGATPRNAEKSSLNGDSQGS